MFSGPEGRKNAEEYQRQVDAVFDAKRTIRNIREGGLKEGLKEGRLQVIMKNFVKEKGIDDDDFEGFEANYLDRNFVQGIWDGLTVENKTKKKYNTFLRELKKRGFMAE
jgi:hypothetical protein